MTKFSNFNKKMKFKYYTYILLFALITISFSSLAQDGNSANIKNGIKIKMGGLTVTKAYLADEDGKEKKLNTTNLNEAIYINLEITGWLIKNGKVNLGASEKIITDKNLLILYEDDLFPGKTDYDAEDAKYIHVKAIITSIQGDIKFFTVKFRVWDKNNGNEVTGTYSFSITK